MKLDPKTEIAEARLNKLFNTPTPKPIRKRQMPNKPVAKAKTEKPVTPAAPAANVEPRYKNPVVKLKDSEKYRLVDQVRKDWEGILTSKPTYDGYAARLNAIQGLERVKASHIQQCVGSLGLVWPNMAGGAHKQVHLRDAHAVVQYLSTIIVGLMEEWDKEVPEPLRLLAHGTPWREAHIIDPNTPAEEPETAATE